MRESIEGAGDPASPDRSHITVEILTAHWLHHVNKLLEAGIPLKRVAASLRTASLNVDDDWFKWAMDDVRERLDALGPRTSIGGDADTEEAPAARASS
jgi:hypothetical protein